MLDAGESLLGRAHEATINVQYVKGKMDGPLIAFWGVNVTILLPFLLLFFYTLSQIIPTIAVVADPNTNAYDQIPLSDLYADAPASGPHGLEAPRRNFSPFSFRLWQMLSQMLSLRTRFRSFALFRGFGIFALTSIFEILIAIFSILYLPALLTILPQTLFPLLLVQLYTLWTHTVLTHSSSKSLWQRIQPFGATLRATGPSLALLLAAKALLKSVLVNVRTVYIGKYRGDLDPKSIGIHIIAGLCVEVIAVAPAHLILTRIQASLLPVDERTVAPLDEALRPEGRDVKSDAMGIVEAWKTVSWGAWARLGLLYAQIFVVVLIGGGATLALEFFFYIFLALLSLGSR